MTSTATKTVSGTKLFIATMAMFGAGSVALATLPMTNFWSGAVDPDAASTFDVNQLFVKSTTKYNGGSKTDYCYTVPTTRKTYLMEGVSRNGKFTTWQKNCAELNLGKPGFDFQCVDGACVNKATSSTPTLTLNKLSATNTISIVLGNATSSNQLFGSFELKTGDQDVLLNDINFNVDGNIHASRFTLYINGQYATMNETIDAKKIDFLLMGYKLPKNTTTRADVYLNTTQNINASIWNLNPGDSAVITSPLLSGVLVDSGQVVGLPLVLGPVTVVSNENASLSLTKNVSTPSVGYYGGGVTFFKLNLTASAVEDVKVTGLSFNIKPIDGSISNWKIFDEQSGMQIGSLASTTSLAFYFDNLVVLKGSTKIVSLRGDVTTSPMPSAVSVYASGIAAHGLNSGESVDIKGMPVPSNTVIFGQ